MWTNRQKRLGLWISAAVLAAGKGWVLAMLAMLGPKRGLRVAVRGSGPGFAALALRCAPCPGGGVGTKGVPPQRRPRGPAGPASNKGRLGRPVHASRAKRPVVIQQPHQSCEKLQDSGRDDGAILAGNSVAHGVPHEVGAPEPREGLHFSLASRLNRPQLSVRSFLGSI